MSLRGVSQILAEDYGISIRPGAKGECPTCQTPHFSLKPDDSLGKCFHPPCGWYLTQETAHDGYGLSRVLKTVYQECHDALIQLATTPGPHAYTYLRDERRVHPAVITEAMLGMVPSGSNVAAHFAQSLQDAQQALNALKLMAGKGARQKQALERAEQRITDLQAAQQALHDCFAHRAGWLVFFYTDSAHRLVALRLREPYTRKFASFKPGIAGVFGRELFTPRLSPANHALNDYLVVAEGEFNVLSLQSLTRAYEDVTGEPLGYIHACAVGGVSGADAETVARCAAHPVIWYDHDANGAGLELVTRLRTAQPVEHCTAEVCPSDLDSFIQDFHPDAVQAWQAVQAVIAQRQPSGRLYSGTGEEFYDYTISSRKKEVFVPKLLGEALLEREHYRHVAEQLWVYRGGVYTPHGEAILETDAQALLGPERHQHFIEEARHYVRVAVHESDTEAIPDRQVINVHNGLLEWATGELTPHTPTVFRIVQLPLAYDPDALAPTFERYLHTTFDADTHPLIEEVLGWCLVPDRRFEKAIMLTGESGENGKSVLIDLIGALLGAQNVSNVALQDLEDNRFRAAELYGKLANVFADLDTRALHSSSMFKTLTTGDSITAERKHQHPFTFRNHAKLIFSANTIPSSRDRTPAFYRRWIIIPFTRTFNGENGNPTPDKGLRDKLTAELPGIFNRAVCGLRRLQANKAFTEPASVKNAKAQYIRQNDNVKAFLNECVNPESSGSIEKQRFYAVYCSWCDMSNERAVSQKALKTTLKEHIATLDEYRNPKTEKWEWLGMEWNTDAKEYFPQTPSAWS